MDRHEDTPIIQKRKRSLSKEFDNVFKMDDEEEEKQGSEFSNWK